MPVVRGTVTLPDLTKQGRASAVYELVDQTGLPVRGWVSATDQTIVGPIPVVTDNNGLYTITLPDNVAINPANTRWRRRVFLGPDVYVDDYLVVPTGGGPYQEEDIAQGITPLPTPTPSNEVGSFVLGATTSDLAVTGFTLVMVPTMIITVGDLSRPTIFLCSITVQHQTVASALLMAAITVSGDTGIGNAKGTAQEYGGPAASPTTLAFIGRIPAHTPGSYQVAVNGAAGNLRVVGGTNGITTVEALGV
jgi:hypothetical protein